MSIKIFHTADIHIGMKFNSYPGGIKNYLKESRIDVIKSMVQKANETRCNIFSIAGDLFHNIAGIDKKTVARVLSYLSSFNGECVLVMPGNHDYDNDMIDLWKTFCNDMDEKIVFLNKETPFLLQDYGLNVAVYPAPCHSKHSEINNIGWINQQTLNSEFINIAIAHGSLEGISPDLDNLYYNMTTEELVNIPVDLWLLGHTHVSYPFQDKITDFKIFNPGTPEPDGLDFRSKGSAWIIDIDEHKKVYAEKIITGIYRFIDSEYVINGIEDLNKMEEDMLKDEPNIKIARIHITGRVDEAVYDHRLNVIKNIEKKILYLIVDDSNLRIKITAEKINREFSYGSFPQLFLSSLADDEEALQLAYELISEVRK